jgi:deoxyadenosine/deoxycytidine kinase
MTDKLVRRLKNHDDRYMTSEEAFLYVSKRKMDIVYRILLNILPHSIGLKLLNKLMGRSLMQFQSQSRFLARHAKSIESFISSAEFDDLSIEDRAIVIGGFIMAGSTYECMANGNIPDNSVVFFDEGFLQKSLMFTSQITNKSADRCELHSYLDSIPLPDLIVYIKADIATCYERMVARPKGLTGRLESSDKHSIMKFLNTIDDHLQNVIIWLQKNKNVDLIEIENDRLLESVMSNLEQRIRARFEADT